MKNFTEPHCDPESLIRLLDNHASSDDIIAIQKHLDRCEQCVAALEQTAATRSTWQQTSKFLSSDEFDPKQASSHEEINKRIDRKSQDRQMLVREIQGWLDPTDDPRMLGRFAGYEVVGIIGHGGMGIVFKAFEACLNRYVAIKVLAPRLASDATARRRFAREAQAAAAVLHDNVVAIHRVDEFHGLPFLVMPYFAGESLQQRIDRAGPISLEATLRLGIQIAKGLAAAHAQGLVHRDIKPANIMLEPGIDRVQITDFGLARAIDDVAMTRTGVIAGTPQYMSPEQATGEAIDVRSDLFSLGSLLSACLTGYSPFRCSTTGETILRIKSGEHNTLRQIEPSLPVWLENLIERLLQVNPSKRVQSAGEVALLLEQCALHVRSADNALPSSLSLPRSLPKWMIGSLVTALIAVLLLVSFSMQKPNTKPVVPSVTTLEEVTQDIEQLQSGLRELESWVE